MIHVLVMKRLIGLPLSIHIELLRRSRSRRRSFKNRGVGVGAFVYRLHSPGCSDLLKKNPRLKLLVNILYVQIQAGYAKRTTTRVLCDCCPDVTRIYKHNWPVDFITWAIKNKRQPTGVQGYRTDLYIRTNVLVLMAVSIFSNSKNSGIRHRID
jgi:hypothetical protein